MPAVRYRLFLDDAPATREQLDAIDAIVVDQEIDTAWEARLTIPICTDDRGAWGDEDQHWLQEFARVRVEVKVGDRAYAALIDGPVVGSDRATSSEPGQSSVIVIVHDDSAYLNREDEVRTFENMLDHEIARQVFNDTDAIDSIDVEDALPCSCGIEPTEVQRGTRMALLRRLARRQGMHAYVLPGPEPGTSIGVFRKLPTSADGLPAMVLLGPDRNIASFNVANDAQSPANVQSYSLSIGERVVSEGTSQTRDLQLLGPESALANADNAGTRLARPDEACCLAPQQSAQVVAERASFSFEATGTVICECYGAALSPYRIVPVRAVGSRLSGDYVIRRVNHRLDRWQYRQEFTVMRNARSGGTGGAADLGAAIF